MHVGFGKADITVFERGLCMLGWGVPENVALDVEEPLFARAMVVRDGERCIAFACADLCFITAALRLRVLELVVSFEPRDVMLTATHTHSGPSGYSHAFFYDLAGPGYSERVLEGLARGIAAAIEEAHASAVPATLVLARATIPRAQKIAFNRSPDAYMRNPEASVRESAVDRTMKVLRAVDARGRAIGMVSFFALHATSIHSDRQAIHGDHKGLAAASMEHAIGGSFVAIFAQGAAGDVTPNYRLDRRRGFTVGCCNDDRDSAKYVAEVQVKAAQAAMQSGVVLDGPIGGALLHANLEEHPVDPAFAGGRSGLRTGTAILGAGMAAGTPEGPGPLGRLPGLVRAFAPRGADPKLPLLRVGPGAPRAWFDRIDPRRVPLPHPATAHLRRCWETAREPAWIPTILPVQLLRIGGFAIAGLPNEPTTIAGARLARVLLAGPLRDAGVRAVHVCGYANAYSGYLTTREEYGCQRYEGAYTLFGPDTLGAYAALLRELGSELASGSARASIGPPLPRCTAEELAIRAARR